MIDILIPVLGRPQNAQKVVDSINAATVAPHITVFLCTRDDHDEIAACQATGCIVHLVDELSYAVKINAGIEANYGSAEFFFMGADDLLFHPGWDRVAVSKFIETERPVIGTNDLGNATVMAGNHSTHTLMHRSYVEQGSIDDPTRVLHEGYEHNFVDSEFIETAKARDAFIFAADSHVEHLHPFWQKADDDVIYKRGRDGYHRDRRLYQTRQRLWRRRR